MEKELTPQESLQLIEGMIQKTKANYHDRGISALLWGTVVTIASLVTYARIEFDFNLGFDIWLIVLFAIIPQIFISIQEKRKIKIRKYDDEAIDAVWIVYAISIFGLVAYQNIVPNATNNLLKTEGWQLMKHYLDNTKPDENITPFAPSFSSIFILIYAFPTFITGLVKKFKPMIIGGIISYIAFLFSLYTETKYDMLLCALAAISNWLIPGIILRRRYLKKMSC
jgi:hypothetical protein